MREIVDDRGELRGSLAASHPYMQIDVAFRGLDPSTSAEGAVRRWIERLRTVYADISACKVVLELPHRHHDAGNAFHVRVEVTVPDRVLRVTHDPGLAAAHEDIYVTIADAFRAMRRQLDHYRGERRDHRWKSPAASGW